MQTKRKNSGFTFVEMLAALVIGSAVASLVLTFLTSSMDAFKVTESGIQTQNEAQFTMNIMMDNIMSCSGIIEAIDIAGNPININQTQIAEGEYLLESLSFAKNETLNDGTVVNYIEKYEYSYDSTKKTGTIMYTLTIVGGAVTSSGELTNRMGQDGFILKFDAGKSIASSKYVRIELIFEHQDQAVSVSNTARYRN